MKPIQVDHWYASKTDAHNVVRPWDVSDRVYVDSPRHVRAESDYGKREFRQLFELITPVPETGEADYYTLDLCECCFVALVNGEPCDCGDDETQHPDGLMGRLESEHITPGLLAQEHESECLTRIYGGGIRSDVPDDYECDCEHDSFATYSCDGCGTYLAGAREGATGWNR